MAIGAVLLGLAGILKAGAPGRIALGMAMIVLLGAVAWALAAMEL